MPLIPPITEGAASEDVAATYGRIKDRYGGVLPEIYKVMARE